MGKLYLPIFFYLLCLTVITSCDSNTDVELELFNGHKYILKPDESEQSKSKDVVSLSDSLKKIYNKDALVLFKYISHRKYDTFLYIDLDSSIKKKNIYKIKPYEGDKTIFYQYIVDKENEITSITLLRDEDFFDRFLENKIGLERFKLRNQEE